METSSTSPSLLIQLNRDVIMLIFGVLREDDLARFQRCNKYCKTMIDYFVCDRAKRHNCITLRDYHKLGYKINISAVIDASDDKDLYAIAKLGNFHSHFPWFKRLYSTGRLKYNCRGIYGKRGRPKKCDLRATYASNLIPDLCQSHKTHDSTPIGELLKYTIRTVY